MTQSAIDQAMRQAEEAAARTLPATQSSAGTAVGAPVAGGRLSAADMVQGALDVDAWLKVNFYGISIGTDSNLFDSIPVELDLSEVMYSFSVRYGNPAKYAKTYDHVTDTSGRPWVETLRQAQQIDPKASEFRSADIPFKLREDAVAKGKTVAKAGDTLGHSLSITGWKKFQGLIKDLIKQGIDADNALIQFDLGFEPKKNDSGQWGVLTFNNVQEVSGE